MNIDYEKLEAFLNKECHDDPNSYNAGWEDGYKTAIKEIVGATYDHEAKRYVIDIDTDKENQLADDFIAADGPLRVMETYLKRTGKDPVTEEGTHTDAFEYWWMLQLNKCYRRGITDAETAINEINKED